METVENHGLDTCNVTGDPILHRTTADVFHSGTNCWIVCDAQEMVGRTGKYVLWQDGTHYGLLALYRKFKKQISQGHDVYFMLKNIGILRNHVELVDGYEDLYVFKRKEGGFK